MIPHSRPTLGDEEAKAVERVVRSGYLAKGTECRAFEEELAGFSGKRHAIVVSSGFAALHLSLLGMGAKPGSRVYLPSYSCTALVNAVRAAGANAKSVDTPHHGILPDPNLPFFSTREDSICIYPQMFGICGEINPSHSDHVIEDCAMAVGQRAFKQGKVSILSFYATKMLTTGQGGAVLTDDEALADEIRDLIAYDNRDAYRPRFNYDPCDFACAIGRIQLRRLPEFIDQRRELSDFYDHYFMKHRPELLPWSNGMSKTFPRDVLFRYLVRCSKLKETAKSLAKEGIEAKSPVFRPVHRYFSLPDSDFPHASKSQNTLLSIPFYPSMTREEAEQVAEAVCKYA